MRESRLHRIAAMVVSAVAATLLVVTTLALAQPGPTFEPLPDPGTRREAPSEPAAITSQWTKLVDNVPWVQGLVVTAETSQTIQVVDVVTTLPADALWLVEKWNPQHLELNGYTVQPAGTSTVNTGDGSLTWELPEAGGVMTLTKTFHVKPCTWASTVLSETLSSSERLIEQRLVTINKEPPNLWIDSSHDSAVQPGQEASFTLSYGNTGGYENDVTIRNTFPAAAPFLSSNPPADDWAADGSWALWTIGELAKGAQGAIAVAVTIQSSAQPSSTIEIWDWIYDHTGEERAATTISFHVEEPPRPEWQKLVDGVAWSSDLVVTAQTSQTIQIVDVVNNPSSDPVELVETWNPEHLDLSGHTVEPAGSTVETGDGVLTWQLPESSGSFTLTKTFHVQPCTWLDTVLSEELWAGEQFLEERPVPISKEPPDLWIDSFFDVAVLPGQEAAFTLAYGNNGGYENNVSIQNTFPVTAPFLSSDPPADDSAADGSWALWTLADLPKGAEGTIAVAVTIQPSAQPSSTIEIWDWIYDHTGEARGSTTISFHVEEPPRPEWLKLVDGVAWSSDLEVTAQTSDTIQVVDVVTTLPFAPLELVQMWNEEHLDLSEHTVEPDGSTIETGEGVLTWQLPESSGSFTLTKTFNVQPCTWTRTVLSETLSSGQGYVEQRPVPIDKEPPNLWIGPLIVAGVLPGEVTSFTLTYANTGGFENDVSITSTFPITAPYLSSDPPAAGTAADGSWALWNLGNLPKGAQGTIAVSVTIQPSAQPSSTMTIWDWIYDHTGEERAATTISFHVEEPPRPEWQKLVDGVAWSSDMVVTSETSDTIEVVDVVTTLPFEPMELVEEWNPEHLDLRVYRLEPGGSTVETGDGVLTWQLPESSGSFTLTKTFHVQPCTWTRTVLSETLSSDRRFFGERPVPISKEPPNLSISSLYDSRVLPGQVATFTLAYGNSGGYENDASIRNTFPATAPFLSSDPPADDWAADGSWALWTLGGLAKGVEGTIVVSVTIQPSAQPSSTIGIWDWIYDHTGEERAATTISFHVEEPPEPGWLKFVDGEPWSSGMVVTAQTSQTIRVVDEITTLPFDPLELVEAWNPEHLDLRAYTVEPAGSTVNTGDGLLAWDLPESSGVFTLTKIFHVQPCTWVRTVLSETLSAGQGYLEKRPVAISKEPPDLWIDSFFDVAVLPGEVASFTLSYGNSGGLESDASIRNAFPATAPFLWSDPPADDQAADGSWALWTLGELEKGSEGAIAVAVAIQPSAQPSSTIEIWDWIYDHVGEERGETRIAFHVEEPPEAEWRKSVNGEAWTAQISVTVETDDIVEVVDVVESPLPFNLRELWDPDHLTLLDYHVTDGQVLSTASSLQWSVTRPAAGPVTLTKRFRAKDGHWPATILEEYLDVEGAPASLLRPVRLERSFLPIDFAHGDWPWYAQGEISVSPEPPMAARPTRICGELLNLDPTQPHTVTLEFAVANFGIGLPFLPVGHTDVTVPPGGRAFGCIVWVPPTTQHWCIEARLIWPGEDEAYAISQRNVDVDEPLQPNTPHARTFSVGNPYPHPVTITLALVPHVPDWTLSLSHDVLPDMAAGETRQVTLTVTPAADLLPDGTVVVDVEAHAMDKLIGGFRKVFHPPVILHRFADPPYAEREITVSPYPVVAGQPTEICVELHNPTSVPRDVEVQFSWAAFGIGIPFTPIGGQIPVHLPPGSLVKECIHWIPPFNGHLCLQVELLMDGYPPQRSQRNLDVDEPLQPSASHALNFPVGNPLQHPVTVTLALIPHQPGWSLQLSHHTLPNMAPGETRLVTLIVTPPPNLPPAHTPVVDVEAYAEGELIGGFRKHFRPPITLHPLPDPPYAEREITVHPEPPLAGWPTQICVELRNPTALSHDVNVQFSWANFGMGIPFTPINGLRPVHLPPHSVVNECIHWIPPVGGRTCLQVELFMEGYAVQRSQRNLDVSEVLVPGQADSVVFQVGNPLTEPVTVTLGLITHLSGWQIDLTPNVLPDMAPGESRPVTLTVVPPSNLPHDGDVVVEVEAYAKNQLIGGFRKLFRPPVPVHRPKDPVYAESEIFVDPYPVLAGVPTKLGVEVFNPTPTDQIVTATFSIANFGIGLPFTTSHIAPNPIQIFVPRHGAARGHVLWTPPSWHGKFCVRVTLKLKGYGPVWSHRNIDIGEPLRPGQPHQLAFAVGTWPYTRPVTVTLGLVSHRPGWSASVSPTVLPNLASGQPVTATLVVTPLVGAQLGTGAPIVDVEGFVDGELIGGFRKLDVPPVPVHKIHEPRYAESEIHVSPYPPAAEQPTQVSAVLHNTSEQTATVELTFGWADFGVGIPFTTTGMAPPTRTLSIPPQLSRTAEVTWTPSMSGHQCIQIIMTDPEGHYEPQRSQRNVDVTARPPCGTKVFSLTLYNDSPYTETVDLGLMTFDVPPSWTVTTVPSSTLAIGPFEMATVKIIVQIPCPNTLAAVSSANRLMALQQASGSVPTIDVEAYVDGELKGGIEIQLTSPEPKNVYLPLVLREVSSRRASYPRYRRTVHAGQRR